MTFAAAGPIARLSARMDSTMDEPTASAPVDEGNVVFLPVEPVLAGSSGPACRSACGTLRVVDRLAATRILQQAQGFRADSVEVGELIQPLGQAGQRLVTGVDQSACGRSADLAPSNIGPRSLGASVADILTPHGSRSSQ